MVERLVANEKVVGSSPIARSNRLNMEEDLSKKNVFLAKVIFHHSIIPKFINILKKLMVGKLKRIIIKAFI